jgi:hypothetical protein
MILFNAGTHYMQVFDYCIDIISLTKPQMQIKALFYGCSLKAFAPVPPSSYTPNTFFLCLAYSSTLKMEAE